MYLKRLEITGFKSFAKKTSLLFDAPITSIVGPNGSGKSNVAEAFRWVLGEQSMKSLRGKRGEDLIFNGGNQSARLGHAAVTVVFDNSSRKFNIDFDEVAITREVYRDGANEYAINSSKVRLRDIIELLSNVSLGVSGHHIISQGEADRILSASVYERRSMIEEALGLKVYRWKIQESEKKLEHTEENIKQVESLRREIAPHLKFLRKQVEKVEKADQMRRELKLLALDYFKKEHLYLDNIADEIKNEKLGPARELEQIEKKISELAGVMSGASEENKYLSELSQLESELRGVRSRAEEINRLLGRLEGMIEIKEVSLRARQNASAGKQVEFAQAEKFARDVESLAGEAEQEGDLQKIKEIISRIKVAIAGFFQEVGGEVEFQHQQEELDNLRQDKIKLAGEGEELSRQEEGLLAKQKLTKQILDNEREKTLGAEREIFGLKERRNELKSMLETLRVKEERWQLDQNRLKEEIREVMALTDREVLDYLYLSQATLDLNENREDLRRQIEKLKIRLEDMGIEGEDVMQEYKNVSERDEYLAKELGDLAETEKSLRQVMDELRGKIDNDFSEGITKINSEFNRFFELLFDGGSAKLIVTKEAPKKRDEGDLNLAILEGNSIPETEDEEQVAKEGIDVDVSLPRKKVRGLQMLSGGERALTSIALLFAMSQVNPPPFLILDETDAALDEANSRKYGEMIKELAKYSQLILITHNRETMSCAGVLYGVTMGADGISRLLSIKFDEATAYAKS